MKQFRAFIEGADGGTGDKEAYKKFFAGKLKKYGVGSPSELSDEDKKKFYDEIDKEWKADHEEVKEWKKSGESNRRCAGGDKRRKSKTEEGEDCEDDDEEEVAEKKTTSYMEHEIEKACKKVRMSPGEIGDFFAALEGK
jgi:hypothetical protein